MKKTIIILIILCFSGIINAQNNLEFNKVIFLSGSMGASITVPNNTVWKITSASSAFYGSSNGVFIENHLISYFSQGTTTNFPVAYFPIWLPSGTYNINMSGGGSGTRWSISGMEFKITQ